MKKLSVKLLLSLLLVFFMLSSFSQRPGGYQKIGVISGKIVEEATGNPMEFVSVAIYRAKDKKVVTGVITNNKGIFVLPKLPYGKFFLKISSIGFKDKIVNDIKIFPKKANVKIGTIKLKTSNVKLEGVEVTADRNRVQYKLDKKVINVSQDINSQSQSAVEVLENTPSIEVDMDGEVSLRGSTNFKVLINGRPSILDGSEALQQIPANAIENIEIITNPSAKYEPEGTAGIINIIMKKEKKGGFTGLFNASYGSTGSSKAGTSMNYITDKYTITGGVNYRSREFEGNVEGWNKWLDDNGSVEKEDKFEGDRNRGGGGYEFKLGTDINLSKNSYLSISGNYGLSDRDHERTNLYSIKDFENNTEQYRKSNTESESSRNYYGINATYNINFDNEGHKLEIHASHRNRDSESEDITGEYFMNKNWLEIESIIEDYIQKDDEVRKNSLMKADYTKPIGEGKIEAGFQVNIKDENTDLKNDITKTSSNIEDLEYDFKRNIYAGYFTFTNRIFELDYMLGLRVEQTDREYDRVNKPDAYSKIDRFDYFPSVHVSKAITEKDQIAASYGKRINRPRGRMLDPTPRTLGNNTVMIGNPDIKPQYTDSYELSYQRKFGMSFFALEAYYKKTKDGFDRVQTIDGDKTILKFANISEENSMGLEAMFNIILSKKFSVNLSYNLYNYELIGADGKKKDNNTWSGRGNLNYKFNSTTRVQLQGYFSGSSITSQGERKGYGVVNLALKKDFLDRKLSATLQMRDVFQSANWGFDTYLPTKHSGFKFERQWPNISLSLSYRLNNYKTKRKGRGNGDDEDGGDMDMM